MSKQNWILVIAAGIIAILYVFKSIDSQKNYAYLKELGHKADGTIIKVDYRNIEFNFATSKTTYSVRSRSPYLDLEKGEHYTVYFDPEEPINAIMDFSSPHFKVSDYTRAKTDGFRILNNGDVELTYSYEGQSIRRTIRQRIDSTSTIEFILINSQNPKIAYIAK